MDFSRFDRYYRYLIAIPLLIALLTYWRFREINLSEVYSYVAQQNVIHPMLQQSYIGARSIVWDFFGLLNKIVSPGSIVVLRIAGLAITILNYFLLSKLLNDILVQRFWGFLGAFLVSLSPFMIVAAVAGVPAASEATIVILFLVALYKNEYVFGGILSGIAVAANLPGLIMLLILILDLLQNATDKKKVIRGLLSSAAGFFGVVSLVFAYSIFSGGSGLAPVPFQGMDVSWPLIAIMPIVVANIVVIAGIIYLVTMKRYDIYRMHFHTFMLWITFAALSIVQPTTSNLLVELVISAFLAIYFIQGFASVWNLKFLSVETFIFIFTVSFLFADIYANNRYLQDKVLLDSQIRTEELDEVVASIMPARENSQIVSNFCPAELAVKLLKPVVEIEGEPFPVESLNTSDQRTIYVVDKTSVVDSSNHGCKLLLRNNYEIGGVDHFVKVIQCEVNSK
jgi:hypothetical protein